MKKKVCTLKHCTGTGMYFLIFFYTVSVYVKNKAGFSGLPISRISGPSPISAALIFFAVLWIRIPIDPELLPGSGSGIIVPDPAESERAYK